MLPLDVLVEKNGVEEMERARGNGTKGKGKGEGGRKGN